MSWLKIIGFSILSTAVLAAPTIQDSVNNSKYKWYVANWSAGCARAGCYYAFNITGAEYGSNPTIPAFSAYCSGSGVGAPFFPCNVYDDLPGNRGVVAKLLPAEPGTGAHIDVSLQWTDLEQADTYYNYTGNATASYNQFVAPVEHFTITPSYAFGVA